MPKPSVMEWQIWNIFKNLSKTACFRHSQFIVRLLLVLVATAAAASTTGAIVLGHNWSADALDLLVLFLDLLGICLRIGVQPRLTIFQSIHNLFLLLFVQLLTEALVVARALGCGPHGVDITVEGILGIHALLHLLVLVCELLGSLII